MSAESPLRMPCQSPLPRPNFSYEKELFYLLNKNETNILHSRLLSK